MKTSYIFLLSVASTALAAPLVVRDQPGAQTVKSLQDLITGALSIPGAFLSGKTGAMTAAMDQMTSGATSFSDNFLKEYNQAMSALSKNIQVKQDGLGVTSSAAPPPTSKSAKDLENMITGALSIPGAFLSGKPDAYSAAMGQMFSGVSQFSGNFLQEFGQAAASVGVASLPKLAATGAPAPASAPAL